MRREITTISALVVLVVTVAEVHAREWQVRVDGSGDFTTIGAAIEAASEGDTISIGPGDYSDETLVRVDKSLVIRASELMPKPLAPIISIGRVESAHLSGVEIRSSRHAGVYSQAVRTRIHACSITENQASAITFWADSAWVSDCVFEGNRGGDLLPYPQAGAIEFVGRVGNALLVVDGCTFRENGTLGDGGAIVFLGRVLAVRNSYFHGNEASGDGGAIYSISQVGYSLTIENNTFIRNRASYSAIYIEGYAYINNNIFAFNDCYGYWVDGSGYRCGCNLFWRNRSWGQSHQEWGGYCTWGDGVGSNEIVDPGFCSHREDDYTLTATSPGLPENFTPLFREQGCTGLVGAFEMGCQESPTREASWGELKRLLGGEVEDSLGRGEKEERGGR